MFLLSLLLTILIYIFNFSVISHNTYHHHHLISLPLSLPLILHLWWSLLSLFGHRYFAHHMITIVIKIVTLSSYPRHNFSISYPVNMCTIYITVLKSTNPSLRVFFRPLTPKRGFLFLAKCIAGPRVGCRANWQFWGTVPNSIQCSLHRGQWNKGVQKIPGIYSLVFICKREMTTFEQTEKTA